MSKPIINLLIAAFCFCQVVLSAFSELPSISILLHSIKMDCSIIKVSYRKALKVKKKHLDTKMAVTVAAVKNRIEFK